MFAPLYHPAMRHAVVPRREIGVRTVFNILGPLTNPAGARRQLTGVAVPELGDTIWPRCCDLLGAEHALVVHGQDGLDEISVCAPTQVHEARRRRGAAVHDRARAVRPAALADATRCAAARSRPTCAWPQAVLDGEHGPARDVVLLNAGAALYVAGLADSIAGGHQAAPPTSWTAAARAPRSSRWPRASQRLKAEPGGGGGSVILDEILAAQAGEVADARAGRDRCADSPTAALPTPPAAAFSAALTSARRARSSPRSNAIAGQAALLGLRAATALDDLAADLRAPRAPRALSVLTDAQLLRWLGRRPGRRAQRASGLPVLRKDFVVDRVPDLRSPRDRRRRRPAHRARAATPSCADAARS